VRGDRVDANGAFLARELTGLGLEPARVLLVGDDPAELEAAVREGLEADVCVLSGGLGPTHDDRTVETLARAAGRALVVDEALEREIEAVSRAVAERLRRPYADFVPGVRKQASLPEGAFALGLAGTAPAVLLERDGHVAVALPGPPNELRRLWPRVAGHEAFRRVVERARPTRHRVLRFFGPSESAVAQALEETGGEGDGLTVTVCAHDLEIRVEVRAPGLLDAVHGPDSAVLLEVGCGRRVPILRVDDERSDDPCRLHLLVDDLDHRLAVPHVQTPPWVGEVILDVHHDQSGLRAEVH